jgi:hypothetical protein
MKRQATRKKNDIYDPYTDKPQVSIRGLMLPLCIAGLVNLVILIGWCNA